MSERCRLAAHAARPEARCQGPGDRHHRHGRDLDAGVLAGRLDQTVDGRQQGGRHQWRSGRPIATATWKGKLYGAPDNSNTQLLWYRKDLVPTPPRTWAQMIQEARNLAKQGKPHYIEVQGRQYEGLTVWFNSLVASAGGQILNGPNQVAVGPTSAQAATIMRDVADSPAADPGLSNAQEDQGRLAFEKGVAAFEVNYPFVWPSAQSLAPQIAKVMGTRATRRSIRAVRRRSRSAASTSVCRPSGSIRRMTSRRLSAWSASSIRRSTRSRAACHRRSLRCTTILRWQSHIRSMC